MFHAEPMFHVEHSTINTNQQPRKPMTSNEQTQDTLEQIEYLDAESESYGFSDITELFESEPELFDILAQEWRSQQH